MKLNQPIRAIVTSKGIFNPKILPKISNRLFDLSLRRGFKYSPDSDCSFGMFLDMNRLDELTEGWWPVVIRERRRLPKGCISFWPPKNDIEDGFEIMSEVLYKGYFYHEDCNGWGE
jgi:hypothetical protein